MPPRGCYSSGVVDPGIPHGFAATRGPKSWAKCAAYSAVTELFACSAWWEVVAAAGHRQDVVEVRRGLRHGLDLRGHLRALTRRRGEEIAQVRLRDRRCVHLRGGSRVRRVERGHNLPVVAGCVDNRIQRICGCDPGAGRQRERRPTNRGGQFGQRQPYHLWTPSPKSMHRRRTATTSAKRLPSAVEATRPLEQPSIATVIAYQLLNVTIRRSQVFAFALSEMRTRA